jgi:ApbE superfamily uncharacterized protein (UPF0280 family)
MYEKRAYRNMIKTDDLIKFEVIVKETDLLIRAEKDLSQEAIESVLKYRHQIERYIKINPSFQTSLIPLEEEIGSPEIIRKMIRSSRLANVGPMASVAGAIAESVYNDLYPFSRELIIENGGDIFLSSLRERVVGIYAGKSPLSLKIGIVISPEETPIGICTSSGTVGHSLSFGRADAVCIVSKSAALSDAIATYIGNIVKDERDIELALNIGQSIPGLLGMIIIVGKNMGIWGNIRLTQL